MKQRYRFYLLSTRRQNQACHLVSLLIQEVIWWYSMLGQAPVTKGIAESMWLPKGEEPKVNRKHPQSWQKKLNLTLSHLLLGMLQPFLVGLRAGIHSQEMLGHGDGLPCLF